jgi:hypothetical protein
VLHMTTSPPREDPIGDRYFRPLEIADAWLNRLFYIAAALSFCALFADRKTWPVVYDLVQISFVISVVAVFVLGLAIRLYWTPRAEDQRRLDLLSNAHRIPLTHEKTVGYYNNEQADPIRRLGAIILENSHFTRAIALEMCRAERIKVDVYILAFVVAILFRQTDLAIASTAAQAVFSEQILSRWFRLEWLRNRSDATYNSLFALFQSSPSKATLQVKVLEMFAFYETGKANAGVMLSANTFLRLNPTLSAEWDKIRAVLKL